MPELEAVVEQKTAGFVDSSYNRKRRQAQIEKEEKELQDLMAQQKGETSEEPSSEEPEDTEVQAEDNTQQEEANVEVEAQEDDSKLNAEERSFKKRYGDLRKHMDEQKKQIKELQEQLTNAPTQGIRPPKSDEDIEQWANEYPDVAAIVETIATKKAKELFDKTKVKIDEFENMQYEAERNKSENAIRKAHADFDELRDSDAFHDWANEQPKWVRDALYENADDPASVIRVIDLYKVDTGKTPSDMKKKAKDAAKSVSKGQRTQVDAEGTEGTFRESQVAKMSDREYESNMEAIDDAIRSGKFIYDISGAAR